MCVCACVWHVCVRGIRLTCLLYGILNLELARDEEGGGLQSQEGRDRIWPGGGGGSVFKKKMYKMSALQTQRSM